jgi:MarR-like DNA-binding transcriptional regulator SgrR of sgrS sRNA
VSAPGHSYTIIIYYILILITVPFISSCSTVWPWGREADDSEETIRNIEAELIERIDELTGINPADEPEEYQERRIAFETALREYLRVQDETDGRLIRLESRSGTIIIPIRVVDSIEMPSDVAADGHRLLRPQLGAPFDDAILDLLILPSENGDAAEMAVLFADSIGILSLEETDRSEFFHPDRDNRNLIRSAFPAGLLSLNTAGVKPGISYITSNLDAHETVDLLYEYAADSMNVEGDRASLAAAVPVEGTHVFKMGGNDEIVFQSIRRTDSPERLVILDEDGYLLLSDTDDLSIVWKSDRPWGNALFKLDGAIAVTNRSERSFMLFDYYTDSLVVRGRSPRFDGMVGAVASVRIDGSQGYAVGVNQLKTDGSTFSQVLYVPEGQFVPVSAADFARPIIPDYEACFIYVDSMAELLDSPYRKHRLHPMIWYNIYETPFFHSNDGSLRTNVVDSIDADSTYTEWTLTFHSNIYFSDGTMLNADDVYNGWKENWKHCTESSCEVQWAWKEIHGAVGSSNGIDTEVAGVEVLDSLRLRIHLERPIENFDEHLTVPCFQIVKGTDRHGWQIGTGPFYITDSNRRDNPTTVTATRNRFYHGGLPPLREITFLPQYASTVDLITERENAGGLIRGVREIEYFQAIDNLRLYKLSGERLYFLSLNPNASMLRTRAARNRIAQAFDRDAAPAIVNEARAETAHSFYIEADLDYVIPSETSAVRFTEPVRIFYLQSDDVAMQIAQRLSVRLSQERIPVIRPEGVPMHLLERIRNSHRYDILVDSVIPFFSRPGYNVYHMLQRNYPVGDDLDAVFADINTADDFDSILEAEHLLIREGYLYPVLRISYYSVLPNRLDGVSKSNSYLLDFSRAWLPKK